MKSYAALFLVLLAGTLPAWCTAEPRIEAPEYEASLAARIDRVAELKAVREEAARRGLRVWLFGGTAAGLGHYVKWDLQREKGDTRYQPDRFDYDYTNIYRSTQDLDLVVDGNATAAKDFQEFLGERFPFFLGSKTAWEVRPLREAIDNKGALLDDFDFTHQSTDSNSTGMIEVTAPPNGESRVKDLRDWNGNPPHFLRDLLDGKITYYESARHKDTSLYKKGENPEIYSVIRYLTKVFQYELKMRPEDELAIAKIIRDFDPETAKHRPDLVRWMNKHGVKLFRHAVNLDYAAGVLDKLGLREKLSKIDDGRSEGSIGWWMRKSPLPANPLGVSGRTAGQLGIKVVGHETGSFLAYESITRAHTGEPNVLGSRNGFPGEAAVHGDGFYTKLGREGARGTGLTIRFEVDPAAREGIDFTYVHELGYVVFHNKTALRVIPESLNFGFREYFELLADGKKIKSSDRALVEKLKRRLSAQVSTGHVPPEDVAAVYRLVLDEVKKPEPNTLLIEEWFASHASLAHPEILEQLLLPEHPTAIIELLKQPAWWSHPKAVDAVLFLLTDAWKNTPSRSNARGGFSYVLFNDPTPWRTLPGGKELIYRAVDKFMDKMLAEHGGPDFFVALNASRLFPFLEEYGMRPNDGHDKTLGAIKTLLMRKAGARAAAQVLSEVSSSGARPFFQSVHHLGRMKDSYSHSVKELTDNVAECAMREPAFRAEALAILESDTLSLAAERLSDAILAAPGGTPREATLAVPLQSILQYHDPSEKTARNLFLALSKGGAKAAAAEKALFSTPPVIPIPILVEYMTDANREVAKTALRKAEVQIRIGYHKGVSFGRVLDQALARLPTAKEQAMFLDRCDAWISESGDLQDYRSLRTYVREARKASGCTSWWRRLLHWQ